MRSGRAQRPIVHRIAGFARRGVTMGEDLADAVSRTAGFARRLHHESGGPLRHAGLVAAAAGDELLLAIFRQLRAPTSDTQFASSLDEAAALVERLDGDGVLAVPQRYHAAPDVPVIKVFARRVGRISFGHATYASPYQPDASVPGAVRFVSDTDNGTVHAWMLRQMFPAPWIVCVHGAGMGDPLADMVAFRAARLHGAGFNVAIPVLPHHGPPRCRTSRGRVPYRRSDGESARGRTGNRGRARCSRTSRRARNARSSMGSRSVRTSRRRSRRSNLVLRA